MQILDQATINSETPSVVVGDKSPWGSVEFSNPLCDGCVAFEAQTGGGFKLSPEANQHVHELFRDESGIDDGGTHWGILVLTVPGLAEALAPDIGPIEQLRADAVINARQNPPKRTPALAS